MPINNIESRENNHIDNDQKSHFFESCGKDFRNTFNKIILLTSVVGGMSSCDKSHLELPRVYEMQYYNTLLKKGDKDVKEDTPMRDGGANALRQLYKVTGHDITIQAQVIDVEHLVCGWFERNKFTGFYSVPNGDSADIYRISVDIGENLLEKWNNEVVPEDKERKSKKAMEAFKKTFDANIENILDNRDKSNDLFINTVEQYGIHSFKLTAIGGEYIASVNGVSVKEPVDGQVSFDKIIVHPYLKEAITDPRTVKYIDVKSIDGIAIDQ